MAAWLIKSEPAKYSWEMLVRDKRTFWDGVRNYQARNNMQAMKKGDFCLFYHSVTGKEVVGVAKVVRTAYPDPTTDDDRWVVMDVAPVSAYPTKNAFRSVSRRSALSWSGDRGPSPMSARCNS